MTLLPPPPQCHAAISIILIPHTLVLVDQSTALSPMMFTSSAIRMPRDRFGRMKVHKEIDELGVPLSTMFDKAKEDLAIKAFCPMFTNEL